MNDSVDYRNARMDIAFRWHFSIQRFDARPELDRSARQREFGRLLLTMKNDGPQNNKIIHNNNTLNSHSRTRRGKL